jgi:hypothetical protein
MRIAVQAIQLAAVATVVQILSAQAFVPTGDVWITSEPCSPPVLSAQKAAPNSAD